LTAPVWKNRDYMLLWGGQVVSTLGSSALSVVYPLLILAITDSVAAAGIAGALRSLPYLIFSLPVGALIDRWNRKRVMIVCDIGRALAALSVPVALWLDALTIGQIYVVAFVEGSLFVFFNIAEVAALPRLVPSPQLPQAAAQNEAAFAAAHIAGPSLGTLIYQTLGRSATFLFDAVSYVVSAVSLMLIKTEFRAAKVEPKHDLGREIMDGPALALEKAAHPLHRGPDGRHESRRSGDAAHRHRARERNGCERRRHRPRLQHRRSRRHRRVPARRPDPEALLVRPGDRRRVLGIGAAVSAVLSWCPALRSWVSSPRSST
jgi:MFS family permease